MSSLLLLPPSALTVTPDWPVDGHRARFSYFHSPRLPSVFSNVLSGTVSPQIQLTFSRNFSGRGCPSHLSLESTEVWQPHLSLPRTPQTHPLPGARRMGTQRRVPQSQAKPLGP